MTMGTYEGLRGLITYSIDDKPCSKKEYMVARGEWKTMDPFERRARIFAKEFKLDDSKFFVNALEATMRVAHFEAGAEDPKPSDVKRSVSEFLTDARLKRFKGIVKGMQDDHSQHSGWSYQKQGNLLRIANYLIDEVVLLWEELATWKKQFERQGDKHEKHEQEFALANQWKRENEIFKKGFRDIDAVYPIDCTNDRSCQSCNAIQSDDGSLFTHHIDCRYLKAVKLL